jgi:hypothetical protein
VTLHRPLRFVSGYLTPRPDLGDGHPEGSEYFKRVPLRLNKLGDEKKSHILASSDELRAEAHTFVQGTAEQVIKQNSELRNKVKGANKYLC